MMRFPESFTNIPGRETLARSQVLQRTWPFVLDMCVAGIGLACFYGVVYIAKYWFGGAQPAIVISQSPRDLSEAASIYQFSRLQRLVQLELPYSAIGLVWNSMVSVAGGWFFLMACEMFVLGTRDFRLPGLGSYLQTAAGTGNYVAITWGLLTMIAIIVATDQLIWRPVIAWSDKFKFEQVESGSRVRSPLLHLLQQSRGLRTLRQHTVVPLEEEVYRRLAKGTKEETHPSAAREKVK